FPFVDDECLLPGVRFPSKLLARCRMVDPLDQLAILPWDRDSLKRWIADQAERKLEVARIAVDRTPPVGTVHRFAPDVLYERPFRNDHGNPSELESTWTVATMPVQATDTL